MPDNTCREHLIEIATPLFAEKGFHGVSVRELATAAGMNLSMVSYYFGGKGGLYSSVLSEQFAVLDQVSEIKFKDIDPLRKFELYVWATVARYRKNPYLLRFYTSELTNPTPYFESIVKPSIQGVLQVLHETFVEGLSQDLFRQELDPMDTILALAGMINFYFIIEPVTDQFVDHSPDRDEKLIQHIMDILTKGIVK